MENTVSDTPYRNIDKSHRNDHKIENTFIIHTAVFI